MHRYGAGVALLLLLAAAHAGDELTDAARRERVSRLRSRAASWYASRKGCIATCPDCEGGGKGTERGRNRGGLETGEVIPCPRCGGRCKVVHEKHYRKAFLEMMTPSYRSDPGRTDAIEDELRRASNGDGWPEAIEKWQIDRVELLDATHGIVWARLNGEREPTPMQWIRADETNGKPDWFVYEGVTDGPWPGAQGTPSEPEVIDWREWYRRADAARAEGSTTLAKLEALKAAARRVVVVETVKIVDVQPSGTRAKVVVCQIDGGSWRATVDVPHDVSLVRGWGKWDRLTWRMRIVVEGIEPNEMRGEILWEVPGSVVWTKNPGVGGYRIDPAEPSSFADWCKKFDAADEADRKELARQTQGKAFTDKATVVRRHGTTATVRFEDGTSATFPLVDPQADEEVQEGDTVVVGRWPDDLRLVEATASRTDLRMRHVVLERIPKATTSD